MSSFEYTEGDLTLMTIETVFLHNETYTILANFD